jgi:sec-independent protein translocase protein TatC
MFSDTRMSFGEHIEDLRTHLIRAIYYFLIALVFSFFIGSYVLDWIKRPVEKQLQEYYRERAEGVRKRLEKDREPELEKVNNKIDVTMSLNREELVRKLLPPKQADAALKDREDEDEPVEITVQMRPLSVALAMQPAWEQLGQRTELVTLSITEAFMAWFKVCLITGFVLGSPWIFIQIWRFVAAGLYPHEKHYVNVYLPFSLGLFFAGVLLCYFVILPKAIAALLSFNKWLGLEPQLRFSEWLGFAILFPVVVGLAFQMPLVMLFLQRIGVITVETYLVKWRIALFVIHVIAAVVTLSPDPISMELIALTMCGLYGLGIVLCRLSPRRAPSDIDVPDPEEMVEV